MLNQLRIKDKLLYSVMSYYISSSWWFILNQHDGWMDWYFDYACKQVDIMYNYYDNVQETRDIHGYTLRPWAVLYMRFVREYLRGDQKLTIKRNWQHRVHKTKTSKTKHNTTQQVTFKTNSFFRCLVQPLRKASTVVTSRI
jgi:hypothetical protein